MSESSSDPACFRLGTSAADGVPGTIMPDVGTRGSRWRAGRRQGLLVPSTALKVPAPETLRAVPTAVGTAAPPSSDRMARSAVVAPALDHLRAEIALLGPVGPPIDMARRRMFRFPERRDGPDRLVVDMVGLGALPSRDVPGMAG